MVRAAAKTSDASSPAGTVPDTTAPELVEGQDADTLFLETVAAMRAATRPKVRVRLLTQLYQFGEKQRYKNWPGVLWRVDLDPNLIAAGNFRASLSAFIEAVTTIGPARVVEALQEAVKRG